MPVSSQIEALLETVLIAHMPQESLEITIVETLLGVLQRALVEEKPSERVAGS